MAKDNKKKVAKQPKEKFIETKTRADGTTDYIVKGSPSKTMLGKIILVVLVAGMVVLPLVALIISLINA